MAIPFGGARGRKGRVFKRFRAVVGPDASKHRGDFSFGEVARVRNYKLRGKIAAGGGPQFRIVPLRGKLFAAEIDEDGDIVDVFARIVKSVKLKPTLGFMATWNKMGAKRQAAFARAVKRTVRFINTSTLRLGDPAVRATVKRQATP